MKTLLTSSLASLLLLCFCSCNKDKEEAPCGNDELIRWFVNGETHAPEFDDIRVYYADDKWLYIFALPTEELPETGFSLKYNVSEESAEYSASAFTTDGDFLFSTGRDLEIAINSFSSSGDIICIQLENGDFSGEFIVMLDNIVESGVVQGKVWFDENNNGLRDANENGIANISLTLKTDSENQQLPNFIPSRHPFYYPTFSTMSNDDGEFSFEGVFIDHPIRVSFLTTTDPTLSNANMGNNDAIDSDFYLSREIPDRKWYHTDVFTIDEGGIKSDIGMGIVEE